MKPIIPAAAAFLALTAPAFAEGDADKGEDTFKRCKSCHMVVSPEGDEIYKGGKTGPNLYGVIGRQAGTADHRGYSKSLIAAGEAGLVWDTTNLAAYSKDPKKFLAEFLDDKGAKSKMTFKLKKGGEDVAAFLALHSPAMEEAESTESN